MPDADAQSRPPAPPWIRGAAAAALVGCVGASALVAGCLLSIDESRLAGDASAGDGPAQADGHAGDAIGGGDATADGASVDAASDGDAGAAEAGCAPAMIQVPAPGGAKAFCVDATEVTSKVYRAFLAAAEPPAAGSQIAECTWNTSYQAGTALGADDIPAGGLDWCDAYAFCAWAGKRLCGAVGGGPVDYASYLSSPASGRWFNACSNGGTQAFPYGDQYQPTYCNGAPRGAGAPVPAASLSSCEGGYKGLFDMSGNVAEFLDGCDTTPDPACGSSGPECDLCLLVGGGFLSGGDGGFNIACGYVNQVYRKGQYVDNGLRCCADLP